MRRDREVEVGGDRGVKGKVRGNREGGVRGTGRVGRVWAEEEGGGKIPPPSETGTVPESRTHNPGEDGTHTRVRSREGTTRDPKW